MKIAQTTQKSVFSFAIDVNFFVQTIHTVTPSEYIIAKKQNKFQKYF